MLNKSVITVIAVALACVAHAQGYVENVALYDEEGGMVTICYDLIADGPKEITLVGKANGFELEIDSVTGDVGVMITAGTDRCIFWESREDYPDGFKDYAVDLDIVVSDYDPIGELQKHKSAAPPDQVPHMMARKKKKALSEEELLKIISDHADDTKKSKKECEKSRKRLEKAEGSSSKSRIDRLTVQRDYDCRDFNVDKRELIDYVQSFEDRTGSKKAKKYLRVLE